MTGGVVHIIINEKLKLHIWRSKGSGGREKNMRFGEKLKKERKKMHLTQEQVAEKIGITRRAYISYEQKDVRPRNKETYKLLASVLDCDVNYLIRDDSNDFMNAVIASGASIIGASAALMSPTGAIAAIPLTTALVGTLLARKGLAETDAKLDAVKSEIDKYESLQRRYQAIALGVISSNLAAEDIDFQMGSMKKLDDIGGSPDAYFIFKDLPIKTWWLAFWSKEISPESFESVSLKARAHLLFSRFTTATEDSKRKVSIIIDDKDLFEELCKFKDHNSYKGTISVILFNPKEATIVKEEYLAFYDENTEECMRNQLII